MNPTMGRREWLLLVALSLLWGGSFFFAEVALAELPPLTVVLGRVGFAALALNAFSLIVWAQVEIDSGLAAILNATTPLFTVLLAHLLTADERLTRARLAGVLLGFAGVALMIGPEALRGLGLAGLAQLAVLGAALSYAFAGIYGRRFKGLAPSTAACGMLSATTVMMLPLALVLEPPWTLSPGAVTWGAVLSLALLSTALAYLIYFRILASAGATNLLLVTFLIPVSALALGIAFLGERPDWTAYGGLALIFAGLAAVDGRLVSRLRLSTSRPSPGP